jgi:hypothetical protein
MPPILRKKSLALCFSFEEINTLKKKLKPDKTASNKKTTRNTESLFSTEINLNTSSDEGKNSFWYE